RQCGNARSFAPSRENGSRTERPCWRRRLRLLMFSLASREVAVRSAPEPCGSGVRSLVLWERVQPRPCTGELHFRLCTCSRTVSIPPLLGVIHKPIAGLFELGICRQFIQRPPAWWHNGPPIF